MAKKSIFRYYFEKIPAPIRNKYLLTGLIFCVWLFFFDKNNVLDQWKLQRSETEMEEKSARFETENLERELSELNTNEKLEKIAREEYLMKKEDEEVFILVEEK